MNRYILLCTTFCFLIGAVAVGLINHDKDSISRRERWVKYLLYFFIVYGMIGIISAGSWYFQAAAVIIAGIGYYEIIINGLRSGRGETLGIALIVYSILIAGFAGFALYSGPAKILSVYFLVFTFDGFSQLCGQLWGKRKLAPSISPNKTIAGSVLGGLIAIMVSIPAIASVFVPSDPVVLFFLLACPAALAGDLAASYYKRKVGVKDYSNLIPGHGGVLDRFDSFIAAGAMYYLFSLF